MRAIIPAELVPVGGGDPIPLTLPVMVVGRRETCDICLKFENVSSRHCEFSFQHGFWHVKDLGSSNGTKVNGERVLNRLLRPGEQIDISKHKFTIEYQLSLEKRQAIEQLLGQDEDVFAKSLMEKAGIKTRDGDRS